MEFITRHMVVADHGYVFNSYLRFLHEQSPAKFCPSTIFFPEQTKILTFLINNANVLVAVFPEDANEILGYVMYQYVNNVLIVHHITVKYLAKRKQIATKLIKQLLGEDKMLIYTSYPDKMKKLKYSIPGVKMVYDPFLITNLRLQEKNGNI